MVAQFDALCRKLDEREKMNQERMDSHEKWAILRFENMDKALDLATKEMDRRLDSLNHIQGQMKDLSLLMIPRSEVAILVKELDTRINALKEISDMKVGSKRWTDYMITSGIAFLIFMIGHYLFKF